MLSSDEMKFALSDARDRQTALLGLIYSIERQAGSLLGLFVTLGLASATAAAAVFLKTDSWPWEIGVGLSVAVALLLMGSGFCLRAMRSAHIALPGRGADFWLWADKYSDDFSDALRHYLLELKEKQDRDRGLNRATAADLDLAKKIGMATPPTAIVVSLLLWWA